MLLAFEPAGDLAEELGQHAGHAGEGGDDLGGVDRIGQVTDAGAGAVVEQPDGVHGLVGEIAEGDVGGVGRHQNGGSPSPLLVSSAVNRSRPTRRPVRS